MVNRKRHPAYLNAPPNLPAFARALAKGESPDDAARLARLDMSVEAALQHPALHTSLMRAVHERLTMELGPIALSTLRDLMLNGESQRIKMSAAAIVVQKLVSEGQGQLMSPVSGANVSVEDMSTEELAALVSDLEGELAGRAKDVSPGREPSGKPITQQQSAQTVQTEPARPLDPFG